MKFPCVYREHTFIDKKVVYVCEFNGQKIPVDAKIEPVGVHLLNRRGKEKKNYNVGCVTFINCNLQKVPQGLTKIFPNLQVFSIWRSSLKYVNKNDLVEYKNLEKIGFCNNQIVYLPGDLFEGFKRLEEISFNGNKLELIEPNILNGLSNLKMVNLLQNPKYNKCFSDYPSYKTSLTLQDIKDDLFVKFYRSYKNIDSLFKVEEENRLLKETIKSLRAEIGDKSENTSNNVQSDIKQFFKDDEKFKDLCVQINDENFSVHKILLAARSPTFAGILKNNPEVGNLNLIDIPVDIFKTILHFLYTDELPTKGTNFMDLFAAAGKLKIKELMEHAAQKLISSIESTNAIDILKLSNKYDHDKLSLAAFEKIKRDNPKVIFKDEWVKEVETVIKIIEAYKMKEEAVRKAEEQFMKLVKIS